MSRVCTLEWHQFTIYRFATLFSLFPLSERQALKYSMQKTPNEAATLVCQINGNNLTKMSKQFNLTKAKSEEEMILRASLLSFFLFFYLILFLTYRVGLVALAFG